MSMVRPTNYVRKTQPVAITEDPVLRKTEWAADLRPASHPQTNTAHKFPLAPGSQQWERCKASHHVKRPDGGVTYGSSKIASQPVSYHSPSQILNESIKHRPSMTCAYQ